MNPDYSDAGDTGDCVESVPVPCALLARLPTSRSLLREHGRRHRLTLYSLEFRLALPVHGAPASVSQAFIKCLGRMGTKLRAVVLPWWQLTVTAEALQVLQLKLGTEEKVSGPEAQDVCRAAEPHQPSAARCSASPGPQRGWYIHQGMRAGA